MDSSRTPDPSEADISSSSEPRHAAASQTFRVLTASQNTSALVFSVFFGLHLASPLAASVFGGSGADKTMMIAREYYLPLEPLLVYAPLAIHLTSSLSKRAILAYRTGRLPPRTSHIIAGYALIPLVLPHILIHRIIPQSSDYPISNLSPSELGFDFVAWSVRQWPGWSAVGYLGLVGVGTWHAGVGIMKVVTWLRGWRSGIQKIGVEGKQKRSVPKRRKIGLRGSLAALLAVVGVSLVRLHGEGKGVSTVMAKRYEAVYARLPWSGMLR
ncbi:MAG: hypothetical protein TREMPRED_002454 [Tremellales sp. Tagirdzhanova-0007]|nr:MAG: hypothetical protein TREMPRED_002454 [Tremellales sp. Tagirdzhanova-0007]